MGTRKNISPAIKKALVTGGGGFVGKAVVKLLVDSGVECIVIGRNHYPELENMGVTCLVGNIKDPLFVENAARGIDTVFHIAALAGIWGKWKDYYETNVLGTENVLQSCLKNNVHSLVYTSSPSVVFNRADIKNGNETLPYTTDFLCHYARTKVMAEKMVLDANSDTFFTCALRPHLIWGPGDPHLLPRLIEKGRQRKLKKVGNGTNLVDIAYVDNVAQAHVKIAEALLTNSNCAGKPYFISQATPVNLWDWINDLFECMDIEKVERSVSFTFAYRMGTLLEIVYKGLRKQQEPPMTRFLAEQLAKSHYFSIANAQHDFGYEPLVSTSEGLARTVQWLKNK